MGEIRYILALNFCYYVMDKSLYGREMLLLMKGKGD